MKIEKIVLENGLKVVVNQDTSSPLVAMNLIYNVGARDEHPEMTGFAHLFEHLMFGGSVNIPSYDMPLQKAGGENNAFTNNDYTNYYLSLPSQNIETAFWLESDRMLALDFSDKGLDVQKKVVIEEFKQRYFNQPYGDMWLHLRPMAYKKHPYLWSTIGKELSHIEKADLNVVKDFFFHHYAPNNAILSLCGNIDSDKAFSLAQKWFGPIEKREIPARNLPVEPVQKAEERKDLYRPVPADSINMAFHMPERLSEDFPAIDLISDILGSGNSSRFIQQLVKDQDLLSHTDAYITGDMDPGLFVITGKPLPGTSIEKAEEELWKVIVSLTEKKVSEKELTKVQNKFEANFIYGQSSILNKAMNIGYYELLDRAEIIDNQVSQYRQVNEQDILEASQSIFKKENCSTLIYHSEKSK